MPRQRIDDSVRVGEMLRQNQAVNRAELQRLRGDLTAYRQEAQTVMKRKVMYGNGSDIPAAAKPPPFFAAAPLDPLAATDSGAAEEPPSPPPSPRGDPVTPPTQPMIQKKTKKLEDIKALLKRAGHQVRPPAEYATPADPNRQSKAAHIAYALMKDIDVYM
jgi:hypothetical protein